jgi:hypothetical protein
MKIPQYFRAKFKEAIFKLDRVEAAGIIATEIYELRNRCAPVQIAIKAIQARESALKTVRKIDSYLGNIRSDLY